jgi:sugar (glycoside-pentoside-hexuronide) transporter
MARPLPRPTPPPGRAPLPRFQKALYGFGDLLIAIRMSSFQFYLLPFYTDVVLLAPWLAGIGKMIGLVWDGLNDPVAGYLSDRTRSRLGRRRPFMLGAAIPLGVAFAAIWSAPAGASTTAGFLYLVGAFVVLDTAFSLYATPYMALGAELSDDYHERTQLAASRALFHLLGLTLGVAVPGILLVRYASAPASGFRAIGIGLGVVMTIVAVLTGLLIRERPLAAAPVHPVSWRTFFDGTRSTFANPPFRVLIATVACVLLCGGLTQTMVPYAFVYWLGRPQLVSTAPVLYLVASIVSLPFWTGLSHRVGKDRAMRVCMLWSIAALALTPVALAPDMGELRFVTFLVLAGLGNGGWMVLLAAITADVIDADELETHTRREGAYFGVWTLAFKWASAVASGIAGVSLQLLGYVPNQPQSAATIAGIKLLYGPVPAALMVLAFVVFWRFPLTRERHAEIRSALDARRG